MTRPCMFWDDYIETCKLNLECWYNENWETGAESCNGYQEDTS